jgi:hypothetical protein
LYYQQYNQGTLLNHLDQVLDQYLSFVSPSPQLFSLLPPPSQPLSTAAAEPGQPPADHASYYILNSPTSAEQQIEEEIERIAAGLFSVMVSLGQVPYIRAPRRNAAEMVARKLDQKIRDHLLNSTRTGHSLFSIDATGIGGLQRPVLLLVDRNVDLVSMIAHGWTYQALIHDCLEMKLGRVTVVSALLDVLMHD